jgi:hypothetical protein
MPALAKGDPDPTLGPGVGSEQGEVHRTIGLAVMLDAERRTVERAKPWPEQAHSRRAGEVGSG